MDTPLDLTRIVTVPPFHSGDLIRPCDPWHPWRVHRIFVKACYLLQGNWMVEVRVYMGNTFDTRVSAEGFEKIESKG